MKEDEKKLSNDDATDSETLSDLEESQSDKLLETNDENDAVSSPDTAPPETNVENIADDYNNARGSRGAGDPM